MKNLLPDTIAARAMLILVVGLAVTHLVSNLFYATDRKGALLTSGGEHAVQWVAAAGGFIESTTAQDIEKLRLAANADGRRLSLSDEPAVAAPRGDNWREEALREELAKHVPADQLDRYRIAYAARDGNARAQKYWESAAAGYQGDAPGELVLVSLRLADGRWLNVATPITSPSRFFSAPLGLSMVVMLVAVTLISALIVRRMTEPLKQLSRAAENLGTDVQAPAIPETGPEEMRRTAHAFNVMQNRIRCFVEDRTQMLGAIAHDLGTPITRLRLRAEFVDDEDLREKMLRDLDDMQQMVASTLAFIREDAASEPKATVDLGSLLTRVCDDITDAGATVELAEIPRWVLVDCRPVSLRRALGNLIENAVKYGGVARVSLEVRDQHLHILIDDDGPGIPENRHEDVFQPFHRLEDSRNRETGGTGLGLAVARTILRAHGGDIALKNRPGGGLRAIVSLPRTRRPGEAEKPEGEGPAASEARDPGAAATGRGILVPGLARAAVEQRIEFNPIGAKTRQLEGRVTTWKTL